MFHQFFQQLNNQNNFLEYFSETSPASPIATNDVSNFVDDWDYRLESHSEPLLNFSAGNHELPPPSKVGDYTYANQVVDYFEPRKFMQNSVGISILKKNIIFGLQLVPFFTPNLLISFNVFHGKIHFPIRNYNPLQLHNRKFIL